MDLLGDYNSDSESDGSTTAEFPKDDSTTAATTAATTERSARAARTDQDTPRRTPLPTTTERKSKSDFKKQVIGKKLLKLSAVLPEHILNQLQQDGGGSDDDSSVDDNEEEMPSSRKKATTTAAVSTKDEGIMGLLSELSKSNSSSRKTLSTNILGSSELFSANTTGYDDSSPAPSSPPTTTKQHSEAVKSEALGAAFLTTTVETTKRKRQEPTTVRNIHEVSDRKTEFKKDNSSSETSGYTSVSSTSMKTSHQKASSSVVPPFRIKKTSSLRSAAPPVATSSAKYSSQQYNAYSQMPQHKQLEDESRSSAGKKTQYSQKKKQRSRKRQMEQMLRAGKLDEVQGDHELEGVSHVYNQEGDFAGFSTPAVSSSTNGAGVRVVPTGSYDASNGTTAFSTDVTSRQKNSNQLNSLLANAASLESHRAQNPHFNLMGGRGKQGSHRATAKRKYGW